MAIEQADNIQTGAPKPTDSRYFNNLIPWVDEATANAGIDSGVRYSGLTVNIAGTEYWYKDGITDPDLVEKITGIEWSGSQANGIGTFVDVNTICSEANLTFDGTTLESICFSGSNICATGPIQGQTVIALGTVCGNEICSTGGGIISNAGVSGTIICGSICVKGAKGCFTDLTGGTYCGLTSITSPYIHGTCICGSSCVVTTVLFVGTTTRICSTCVRSPLISGTTFATSSTSLVSNLNADLLDGFHASDLTGGTGGGGGDVTGTTTSVINQIPVYADTAGKEIKCTTATISSNTLTSSIICGTSCVKSPVIVGTNSVSGTTICSLNVVMNVNGICPTAASIDLGGSSNWFTTLFIDDIYIDDIGTKIDNVSGDLTFFDTNNVTGATLSSLVAGGTGGGDVTGTTTSVINQIPVYADTAGKEIKCTTATINNGTLTAQNICGVSVIYGTTVWGLNLSGETVCGANLVRGATVCGANLVRGHIICGTSCSKAPLFCSTISTGTAPIQVVSTTVNTNLNADLLDGYHASDLTGGTGGGDVTEGSNAFSGRIAIWGTPPSLDGDINLTWTGTTLTIGGSLNMGTNYIDFDDYGSITMGDAAKGMRMRVDGTYLKFDKGSATEALPFYITADIGTTYIYSAQIKLGSTSGTVIDLRGNSLTHNGMSISSTGLLKVNNIEDFSGGVTTIGNATNITGDLDVSGDVGIGATAQNKLHVKGSGYLQTWETTSSVVTDKNTLAFYGSAGTFRFIEMTDAHTYGTEILSMDLVNGRVGILDSTPSYTLDVCGISRATTCLLSPIVCASTALYVGDKFSVVSDVPTINLSGSRLCLSAETATCRDAIYWGQGGTTMWKNFIESNGSLSFCKVSGTGNFMINANTIEITGCTANVLNLTDALTCNPFISFYCNNAAHTRIGYVRGCGANSQMVMCMDNGAHLHLDTAYACICSSGSIYLCGSTAYLCGSSSSRMYGGTDLQVYAIANCCVSLRYNGSERFKTVTNGICLNTYCGFGLDWISTSDCCLKTDIIPISNALSIINCLCGVCFKFCDDVNDENRIGLIAQDVELILPEVVTSSEPNEVQGKKYSIETLKGIKYDKITAVLIEAVKEQQTQIICLQEEISKIKK